MPTVNEIARSRLASEPCCGVAAAVVEELRTSRDGYAWAVCVTDGQRSSVIEVGVSGTQASSEPAESLSHETIAAAVERRAGLYDREHDRLASMVADTPLQLRAHDLVEPVPDGPFGRTELS